jgi:predicted nucleic acid-binding protein
MPVEPGIIDANVLVYAMDADHPNYAASRTLLDAARIRSTTLYVTPQILCEFYSIVTNPRRVPKPRSPADAIAAISRMLIFLRVLPMPARVATTLLELLKRRPIIGGDIFDLQIVATMKVNGIQTIYTFNAADFQVFPELTVIVPGTS